MTRQFIEAANSETETVSKQHADSLLLLASSLQANTNDEMDDETKETNTSVTQTSAAPPSSASATSLTLKPTVPLSSAASAPHPSRDRIRPHAQRAVLEARSSAAQSNVSPARSHSLQPPLPPSDRPSPSPSPPPPSNHLDLHAQTFNATFHTHSASDSSRDTSATSNVIEEKQANMDDVVVKTEDGDEQKGKQRKRNRSHESDSSPDADAVMPPLEKRIRSSSVPVSSTSPDQDHSSAEPPSASPSASARPSTPHTAALLCEERDLPTPAPVQAIDNGNTNTNSHSHSNSNSSSISPSVTVTRDAISSTHHDVTHTPSPRRNLVASSDETAGMSSENPYYRQQERVMLNELADVINRIVDAKDQQKEERKPKLTQT